MEPGRDLIDFLDALERHRVDYPVVGGMAVGLHGRPRYTKDMDVLIRREPENVARLLAAIDDFEFSSLGLRDEDFPEPGMVIQLGYEPNRIDLLTSLVGVSFERATEGRVRASLGGASVWVIGLEALVEVKRLAGRPQDLLDAEALSRLAGRPGDEEAS